MVGEPEAIRVEAFAWDFTATGNVRHLAGHDVRIEDVEAVLDFEPMYFSAPSSLHRRATHAMVGRDGHNRSLIIFMLETLQPGVWEPVTGWRSRLAHRLLAEEGRI
jgi:hypothetical protein